MNILISGVGGQGTILTSKILAKAAIIDGQNARTGETIGMSQRGGCVVSNVRIGDNASPYIPSAQADLLISFELCEGARNLPMLRAGAPSIISRYRIKPITTSLGFMPYEDEKYVEYISGHSDAHFCDADSLVPENGMKTVNVVFVGIAFGLGYIPVGRAAILESIKANVPAKFFDLNMKAFENGESFASKLGR